MLEAPKRTRCHLCGQDFVGRYVDPFVCNSCTNQWNLITGAPCIICGQPGAKLLYDGNGYSAVCLTDEDQFYVTYNNNL